jgi:hypothetical protein
MVCEDAERPMDLTLRAFTGLQRMAQANYVLSIMGAH